MTGPAPTPNPTTGETVVPMRLQKFLARAGVASRRGSEDLMTAGRVSVNGEIVRELGSKVDPNVDKVCVDGKPVHLADGKVYLVLNKPAGYLTTMDDPQGRPCVASLVPTKKYPGLFPVGRLDKDTTGALLFMTDGTLARDLLHPRMHVNKVYEATVEGVVSDKDLEPLRHGIMLDDGPCAPAQVRILRARELSNPNQRTITTPFHTKTGQKRVTHVEVIIHEGRKRQVKRMLSKIGHPVVALHRQNFGPIVPDGVPEGSWRLLTKEEVLNLKKAAYGSNLKGPTHQELHAQDKKSPSRAERRRKAQAKVQAQHKRGTQDKRTKR